MAVPWPVSWPRLGIRAGAPRARSRGNLGERCARWRRRWWRGRPDFVAVHMTWGAINELTTRVGYGRPRGARRHPVLSELLGRIMRDESRHFAFYFSQAAPAS